MGHSVPAPNLLQRRQVLAARRSLTYQGRFEAAAVTDTKLILLFGKLLLAYESTSPNTRSVSTNWSQSFISLSDATIAERMPLRLLSESTARSIVLTDINSSIVGIPIETATM